MAASWLYEKAQVNFVQLPLAEWSVWAADADEGTVRQPGEEPEEYDDDDDEDDDEDDVLRPQQ